MPLASQWLRHKGQQHEPLLSLIRMAWIFNVFGVICIAVALHDIFHTLFHPAGRGAISDWIARFVWAAFRRLTKRTSRFITFSGPVAMLLVMMSWVFLIVLGFTLVYAPYISTQFALAPGLDPASHRTLLDAFNVSLGSLITVGGDFNAKSRLIRLCMGIEATIGFGLLTASVSWLLSVYPVLQRRRTFAHEAALLHHSEMESGIGVTDLPPEQAQQIIWGLAGEMATLRNDIIQFPITYYFHSDERQSALAGVLPYLSDIGLSASRPGMPPAVRMAGIALGGAIDNYLEHVAATFLRMPKGDKRAILDRYMTDQRQQPVRAIRVPQRRVG